MPTRRELITGRSGARAATARPIRAPKAGKMYGAEYFSNVTLSTHEGNKVRFYDDLIRGKIAVINMMYAQCEGICPTMTANLVRVQELLGERVGRDIFMYSITLLPEQDTTQDLREYAEMHGIKPGWLFLTGTRAGTQRLRYQLGFYDPDPVVDGDKSSHTRAVRIGNDRYDRWIMAPALAEPEQIVASINHVDRSVVHTSDNGVTAADST